MGIFGFGNKQDSTGNYIVPVDNDSLLKKIMNFLRGKVMNQNFYVYIMI